MLARRLHTPDVMARVLGTRWLALLLCPGLIILLSCGSLPGTRTQAHRPSLTPESDSFSQVRTAPTATPLLPPTPSLAPWPSPSRVPTPTGEQAIPTYTYSIVSVYPHDRAAFTEGLAFAQGGLYESTGRYGESTLRRVALETGEVLQLRVLPPEYFGEGIALNGDEIVQLTWQSHLGFVYGRDSFDLLRTFHYPTEGWGLTSDGRQLIMSDGTDTLHLLDPNTLVEIGQIHVHDSEGPVPMLNELEYVDGQVYANVWKTDRIAIISLSDAGMDAGGPGRVTAWIDLAGLLQPGDTSEPVDVLNGIAYDPEDDRLFVTGKLWPKLFEIDLLPNQ